MTGELNWCQLPSLMNPSTCPQGGVAWNADAGASLLARTAQDDQFLKAAGAGWDPRWTEWDVPGMLTPSTDGGAIGGVLTLATTGPAQHCGMFQAKPNVEFACATKVLLDGQGQTGSTSLIGGLFVAQNLAGAPATTPFLALRFYGQDFVLQQWTDYQTFSATINGIAGIQATALYLRLRVNGANYFADWSTDGAPWREIQTGAIGFTPAEMGLLGFNQSGGTQRVGYRTFQAIGGPGSSGYTALRLGQFI